MKTALYSFCCLFLLGILVDPASAAVITVNVTAHVVQLSDPNGVLAGQIVMGQAVTGSYTYDTSTPANGGAGSGEYQPAVPPATLSLSAGPLLFQTYAPQPQNLIPPIVQLNVQPGSPNNFSSFFLTSSSNQLLNSGVPVGLIDWMSFNFFDSTGQWPTSVALPSGAPSLQNLGQSAIMIQSSSSINLQVIAQIDSVALAPPTLAVSPASGSFLLQQQFDAAVVLPVGAQAVVSMQASANGAPLPFNYPGNCTLTLVQPFNPSQPPTQTQQAIQCSNANTVFFTPLPPSPPQPGLPLPITWQVSLADGTIITKTVTWTLLNPAPPTP